MLTYGFYNSLNHDRTYDAIQVSSIFDGIIEDGVYSNIGEFFATVPGNGMTVTVKTGRAWFDHTWTLSDAWLPLDVEESDFLQTRIDAVVLEVDSRIEKRENSIKIVKGVPSVNPVKPTLLHEGGVYQHPLAYITVTPETTAITGEDIEIVVGKEECPFVQAPLKTVPIEDIWQQWDAEFTKWFDNLKAIMTDNVVTNLQRQIDEKVNIVDRATEEDIKNKNPNKWVSAESVGMVIGEPGDYKYSSNDLSKEPGSGYIKAYGNTATVEQLGDMANSFLIGNRYVGPSKIDVPASQTDDKYNAESIYSLLPVCCSKQLSIEDYSYFPVAKGSFCKFNWKTKKKDRIVKINHTPSCYGIVGENVIVSEGSNIYVYDKNLTLLKTRPIKIGTSNAEISWFAVINDSMIVCLASDGTSASELMYTTDMFTTLLVAAVDSSMNGSACYLVGKEYIRSISYPSIGALIQKDDSGKLYFKPNGESSIYVSETYGTSWIKHSINLELSVSWESFIPYQYVLYKNKHYFYYFPYMDNQSYIQGKKYELYSGESVDSMTLFKEGYLAFWEEPKFNDPYHSFNGLPVFLEDGLLLFYNSKEQYTSYIYSSYLYSIDLEEGIGKSYPVLGASIKETNVLGSFAIQKICNVGNFLAYITIVSPAYVYTKEYSPYSLDAIPKSTYQTEELPKISKPVPPYCSEIIMNKEKYMEPICFPIIISNSPYRNESLNGFSQLVIAMPQPFPIENGIVFTMYSNTFLPESTNYLLIETDKRQLPYEHDMYIKVD